MRAVFHHELSSWFTSMTAYIFSGFLLLFAGIYTMAICLNSSVANFEYVLSNMSFTFMIIVPIITMRVIAQERRQKTDKLLYSLPISMTDVVMGKFLAIMVVFLVPTVIIGLYPLVLRAYGDVNLKAAYATLLSFYCLGAALISVGVFISSLTESQGAAAGICFAVMLVNYFSSTLSGMVSSTAIASLVAFTILGLILVLIFALLTKNMTASILLLIAELLILMLTYLFAQDSYANLFPTVMDKISLFARFDDVVDGVLDLTTIVYDLSVAAVFLFLTVHVMDSRRWAE